MTLLRTMDATCLIIFLNLFFQSFVDVFQVARGKLLKGGDLNRLNVLHDETIIYNIMALCMYYNNITIK